MITMAAGRDYNTYNKYEFVVYDGENIVARKGGFSSSAAAKKAGIKAANDYITKPIVDETLLLNAMAKWIAAGSEGRI